MATLNDTLEKYIDKYVKIGGKSGFFFCGYIHDDYCNLFKHINSIERDKVEKWEDNLQKDLDVIMKNLHDKEKQFKHEDDYIAQVTKEANYKAGTITKRINTAKECLVQIKRDLLNSEVTKIYHSTEDPKIVIIIIDYKALGTYMDREEMIKKNPYKSLCNLYDI